ncbi:MAG TPA: 3-oxoacyl-[acyl-carrier-protein] synthase III C-terminal domain-containing protein [Vicinamibacteria bacterium]|nr:3-oxoacyl-[acyl-carrier-protein] synthase III C-terminal domain-containing protein [Vicinamibacteria bacterium]
MLRAVIIGSGSEIPPNQVTNSMLTRIMDTSDEWIRERSGVETRYYVDPGTATSDLALAAAQKAIAAAGVSKDQIDMVVFATMTPDYYFPGCGGLLQTKLGLPEIPCFDIRQQCVGFLYGLQLVDAHIRAGLAKTVLLVGAEIHTGFMPWTNENWAYMLNRSEVPPTPEEYAWNTRFRHLTVLFGDGAAAVVVTAVEGGRGIVDQILRTNGADFDKLYVPGTGFKHRPYTDPEQFKRGDHVPVMDGRYVFKMATTSMIEVSREILKRNGIEVGDLAMVLMHQANRRINEYCQKTLGIPEEKIVHNIQNYGNTTAATIPLLWDECARAGRIKPGDLVLMVAFGAGMNWGATLIRV